MTTRIKTNLNLRGQGYKHAAPRIQTALENIATDHAASGLITIGQNQASTHAYVFVRYASGALLRDVVAYLDEMRVLD